MFGRIRPALRGVVVALAVLPSFACGQIDIPMNFVLEDPSTITLELGAFSPPYDMVTSDLVGSVQSTVSVDLGLAELLGIAIGNPLVGDVTIDDILIAGTEVVIGGLLPTGTVCVNADEMDPGGGTATIAPLLGVANFLVDLNAVVSVADPVLGPLIGAVPLSNTVDTTVAISFIDLLGLLGGTTSGLSFSQTFESTLPPGTPIVGAAPLVVTLTFSTSDVLPTDEILNDCL